MGAIISGFGEGLIRTVV